MDKETLEALAEVLKAAAASPYGLAALVMLLVSVAALKLFSSKDRPGVRLVVFLVLVGISVSVFAAALYSVEPTVPSTDTLPPKPPARPDLPVLAPKLSDVPAHPAMKPSPIEEAPGKKAGKFPAAPAIEQPAPPPVSHSPRAEDCGRAPTNWARVGGEVPNPCPAQCVRAAEVTRTYRVVGFPPHPEIRYEFQCLRKQP